MRILASDTRLPSTALAPFSIAVSILRTHLRFDSGDGEHALTITRTCKTSDLLMVGVSRRGHVRALMLRRDSPGELSSA